MGSEHAGDVDIGELSRLIDGRLKLDDLKLLCADLGIEYENLAGETRKAKALSLVETVEREQRTSELLLRLEADYPNVRWNSALADNTSSTPLEKQRSRKSEFYWKVGLAVFAGAAIIVASVLAFQTLFRNERCIDPLLVFEIISQQSAVQTVYPNSTYASTSDEILLITALIDGTVPSVQDSVRCNWSIIGSGELMNPAGCRTFVILDRQDAAAEALLTMTLSRERCQDDWANSVRISVDSP